MIKTPLRGYQQEAVDLALAHDGFLVFAEQRTGKCLISLAIVDARKPKHLWIVCPIGAMLVWKKQIAEHLKVDWDCELVMINYEELVARNTQYYKEAKKLDGLMIIADEIHKTKKRGTITSRSLRTLSKRAKWKLGLTGTPLGNGLEDGWAYFDFIDPTIFGPFSTRYNKKTGKLIATGFEDKHLIYGGFGRFKVTGYFNQEEFYRKFHSRSFRVTLREARGRERPMKLGHRKIMVDLTPNTQAFYDELEEKMIIEINKKVVKVPIVIALIAKLQQITGGFIIDSEEKMSHQIGTEKWRALWTHTKWLRKEDKKFVVVCRFLHEIDFLERKFAAIGVSTKRVAGGFPYNGKFDVTCILIQIQSGVAVDMSAADDLFFYSADYSYLNFEQMKSRILNYTKVGASFHYLLARATIDEPIHEAVTRKKNVAHLVLDKYRMQKNE